MKYLIVLLTLAACGDNINLGTKDSTGDRAINKEVNMVDAPGKSSDSGFNNYDGRSQPFQ